MSRVIPSSTFIICKEMPKLALLVAQTISKKEKNSYFENFGKHKT